MLRAESRGHNSLRSDKCPLFSNAFFREPRGSQSPRNQAPESEGRPALGVGLARGRAGSRKPRGSQSPRNQAPESEAIPALGSGGSRERIEKRTAGSDTPSESAVLFYLCVIIQFDDN